MENLNKKTEGVTENTPNPDDIVKNESSKADNMPEEPINNLATVDALEDTTMKLMHDQSKTINEVQEATDHAAEGKIFEEPKKKERNYANAGSDSSVVTANTVSTVSFISADTAGSFVDIDPEEKNSARIQHSIDHIAADIVKEGTVGVSEDYINGRSESDTAIERESMDSVQRAVAMAGVIKSSAAGGATQMGQFFESSNDVIDFTDHMYHTSTLTESDYSIKGMDQINGVVLNEFDADGAPTGDFVFIPQRHVLVLGFDPLPTTETIDNSKVVVGTKTVSSGYNWSTRSEEIRTADVYMRKPGSHGLFKTIDVTATLEGVASTAHSLIQNVASLNERAKLGEIEATAFALSRVDLPIASEAIIPENVELHPSYKRCSLYELDPITVDNRADYSCHNRIESVAKFIKYMNQSEVLWAPLRIPFGTDYSTMWNGYKMRKNLAGKDESMDYYTNVMRANNFACEQTVPGLNNFAGYINTNAHGRCNTVANFVYRFNDLKRKVDDFINQFATNKVIARSLTRAMTNLASIEQYIKVAEYGKLPYDTASDHFAKSGGVGAIMLNYDPNDLIQFNTSTTFKVKYAGIKKDGNDPFVAVPYPCAGYINSFRVDTTKINGLDTKYYVVAPSFIRAICSIYTPQNKTILEKLLDNSAIKTGGEVPSVNTILANVLEVTKDTNGDKYAALYQPLSLNTDHPEWIQFYLNELLFVSGYNSYLSGELDSNDGYDRLNTVFSKDVNGVSFRDYISDGGISVSDAIAKIVNNTQLYPSPSIRKVSDLSTLTEGARDIVEHDNIDYQFAVISNKTTTYSFSMPDTRDFDLDDISDYEVIGSAPSGHATVTSEDISDKLHILNACRTKVANSANKSQKMMLASIGENEFVVCYNKSGKNNLTTDEDFSPILLRKRDIDIDDAKFIKRRHIELATGAEVIEHFGEDIAKQLYGYDDHYWNAGVDGYAIKISKHYPMNAGVKSINDANLFTGDELPPYDWTMSIVPVIKFKTTKRNKDKPEATITDDACEDRFVCSTVYKHEAFGIDGVLPASASESTYGYSCNLIRGFTALSMYSGKRKQTPVLANYMPTDKGWKFMFNYADIKEIAGNNSVEAIERNKFYNFSTIIGNFNSDKVEIPTAVTETSHVFEDNYRGKLVYTEAFIPYTGYAIDPDSIFYRANKGIEKLTESDFLRMTDCGNLDVTLARYWDSQYYRTTGLAGKAVGVSDVADMAAYYAACNLPVCPEILVDIDEFKPEYSVNNAYGENVYIYKTPGNHINTEMYPMLYESFDEFANGRMYMKHPARWFFTCVWDGGLLDAQDVGVLAVMPNNIAVNPIINSRFYRRDYCDYVAFKPLITLNKNWEKKFAVNRKLAETFYNQSLS